ncbi:MAG: hypothetical protein KGO50_16910 [Myxococcales bacterium]|nr:hypothetical protein [Myxococcales bacterium]
MNAIAVLLVCAGIMLIMANELVNARREPRVVYRYLPRDLDAFIREQPYASVTFGPMFNSDFPVTRRR